MVTGVPLLVFGLTYLSVTTVAGDKLLLSADTGLYTTDTETNTTTLIYKETVRITNVDYHLSKGYLFYTFENYIVRRNISSPATERSLKLIQPGPVSGLVVDWINDNIYWTNRHGVEIQRALLDGSQRKAIIEPRDFQEEGLDSTKIVYDVSIDPYERLIFAIAGENPGVQRGMIVRADYNGDRLTAIADTEFKSIITFGVSPYNRKLYVTGVDDHQTFLYSCDYNCTGGTSVSSTRTDMWVNPLLVYLDRIYLLHNYDSPGSVTKDQLYRMSFARDTPINDTCNLIDTSNLTHISDMRVFGETGQMSVDAFQIFRPLKPTDTQLTPFQAIENYPIESCAAKFTKPVTTTTGDKIFISADTGLYMTDIESDTTSVLYQETGRISSIDYHYSKGYLYYTFENYIMRRNISSPATEKSLKLVRTETAYGLAVNWINDKIYWTNSHGNEIERASLDGSGRTVIIVFEDFREVGLDNINIVYDISIDPYEGVMFAVAGDNRGLLKGALVRADLNGDKLKVIADAEYKSIVSFAISYYNKKLYATGVQDQRTILYSCDYDGARVSAVSSIGTEMWVNPMHVFLDRLYMVLNYDKPGSVVKDILCSMPLVSHKSVNESRELIDTSDLSNIYDMKVFGEKAQRSVETFRTVQAERARESHLVTSTTPKTTTSHKNRVGTTPATVTRGDKLLISADTGLYMTDTEKNTTILLYEARDSIWSVDYHYSKGYVYYTFENYIMRRNISSTLTEKSVKLMKTGTVFGLAVDWINDNIYWTNSYGNQIEAAFLDGSRRSTIVGPQDFESEGLNNINIVSDISIDPYERIMFAIAGEDRASLKGTLVRADLNGDRMRVIADAVYKTVMTFGIDYHDQRLYVTGVQDQRAFVYSCDYNGARVSAVSSPRTEMWVNPLHVFLDRLYLLHNFNAPGSVIVKDQLYRVSLASEKNACDLIDTSAISQFFDMKVFGENAQKSVDDFRIVQSQRLHELELRTSTPGNLPLDNCLVRITGTDEARWKNHDPADEHTDGSRSGAIAIYLIAVLLVLGLIGASVFAVKRYGFGRVQVLFERKRLTSLGSDHSIELDN